MALVNFEVYSDEVISESRFENILLEPGECRFEVASAEQKVSASGNNMVALRLKVYDSKGQEANVFDYLVPTPGMAWKVKHFCEAVGISYENGLAFDTDLLLGAVGMCEIEVKRNIDKKAGIDRGMQNRVADYAPSEITSAKPKADKKAIDPDFDDDIPF